MNTPTPEKRAPEVFLYHFDRRWWDFPWTVWTGREYPLCRLRGNYMFRRCAERKFRRLADGRRTRRGEGEPTLIKRAGKDERG